MITNTELDWHLVRCVRGRLLPEVAKALEQHTDGLECFYRDEEQVVRGVKITRRAPLFGTPYVFAAWPTHDAETWHRVRWTRGVAEIVGGAIPAVVPTTDVEAWRALASADGTIDEDDLFEKTCDMERGEPVSFEYGALGERRGTFYQMRGNSAGITIDYFGRSSVVYVPISVVTRYVVRMPKHLGGKRRLLPQD